MKQFKVGLQLFSIREALEADFDEVETDEVSVEE